MMPMDRPHAAFSPFALGAGLLFWSAIFAAVYALVTAVRS